MLKKSNQTAERGGTLTAQPPVVPPTNATAASIRESEFFRPPKPKARCVLSGLARSTILERGVAGDFKMIRLRKRGSQRGIVLIETKSFLGWLHGQPPVTEEKKL
jgi:hypothetical protein